jgi:hypothetical protein
VLVLTACGGNEPRGSSSELDEARPDEPGSTRASREASEASEVSEVSAAADGPLAPEVAPRAEVPRPILALVDVDAREAEDGRGETVAASRPVAIDLDARRFPPRALDPTLHVGELRFLRYAHPRPGVLRFVVADRALLPAGAEVAVQYGDDPDSRVLVTSSLEVPQ